MKAFLAKVWNATKTFFATVCKATASFFKKTWAVSMAHKAIAISVAATVVVGTTCAIVLPIALHNHKFAEDWCSDAESHWHSATCKHEEEKSDSALHTYDNACDVKCDVCGYIRTAGAHTYDNACDTTCNTCGATRAVDPHDYDNACDTTCNTCGATRTVDPHAYDNACDTTCNTCGATRAVDPHAYDNACDTTCNTCGATRTVDPHAYDNACDTTCNTCGATRTVNPHAYDNACDTTCNTCGATRQITHNHATTWTAGETTHWYACSVCGDKKDEAAHSYIQTVASSTYLKAEATASTKAQYWKSCVCGAKSNTEYFETDKLPANLQVSDISKTYDGTPVSEPNVTFDGDGAKNFVYYSGTTLLPGKPVNAGTYKVVVTVDETETHAADGVEREFTIAKKVISNLTFEFVYDGQIAIHSDPLTEADGIVVRDLPYGMFVTVEFDSKNAGANVDRAYLNISGNVQVLDNYELDRTTVSATIVPKVLNDFTYYFTYNGGDGYKQINDLTSADHSGIIGDDKVMLEVDFETGNVDAAVVAADFEEGNYVLGTYDFEIVPYDIDISDLRYRKVYDAFNDTITVIHDGTLTGVGDETISLRVEMSTADVDSHVVGSYFGGSANTANYTFGGMTAEEFKEYAEENAQITPKALQITDVVTKNYDGNNTFTVVFTEETGTLDGNVVTVTFKLKDTATQNAVINIGPYSDATIYDAVSNDGNYVLSSSSITCDAHVLDTNPLVLEVTDRFHIENDYILVSNIRQGSVKVGDSIVLPGSPDKVYEVLKIERLNKEQGQATLGEEVGIYIDGMADLSEVARGDLLYTQGNIPTLATTFFADIYAYKSNEGGRNQPFFNNYQPNIVGLGAALQVATIEIVDVYGKDDVMVEPGDRALVKITLTNAVPASLLENLNFTMKEGSKTTITGTVVDYVESHNHGNSMVATDNFDAVAGMPTVIKLTNTRDETLKTLQFYYETVPGSGNYITDFTIKLYDSSFNLIDGTFDNQTGAFTKADSSRWELAEDETCYIVLTTENDTAQVFGWLQA